MNVQIANPIYDVVFKYLMEDNSLARLIVSTIIGEEVVSLEPRPQERTAEAVKVVVEGIERTVYRLDYKATIKSNDEYRSILIEMQKAVGPNDIMRFRRYVGEQFTDINNSIVTRVTPKGEELRDGMPIYCVFFMGDNIYGKESYDKNNREDTDAIVKVRYVASSAKNENVLSREKCAGFIDRLHHNSWIIQINFLHLPRETEAEELLGVFDQSYITDNRHLLNVSEDDFSGKFHGVVRRLQMAASDKEVRHQMIVQDEFEEYIRNAQVARELEVRDELQAEITQKDQTIAQKDQTIAQKDQTIAQKDQTIAQNKAEIAQKDNELQKLRAILQQSGIKL